MFNSLNIALLGVFAWTGGAGLPQGTQVPVPVPVEYSVRLTAYNAVPEQTDADPEITASGLRSNPEVIAARSRDLSGTMPFGTVISLESPGGVTCGYGTVERLVGYRVIADAMHERKKKQVDVLFDMKERVLVGGKPTNPAVAMGVCDAIVRVIGKLPLSEVPETQAELASLVRRAKI